MIRGTTPTHTFALPFDSSVISALRIIYAQGGEVIVTKTLEDVTVDGNDVSVKLTQEDTLSFDSEKAVEIQIRILTPSNDAIASNTIVVSALRCLENEVLA